MANDYRSNLPRPHHRSAAAIISRLLEAGGLFLVARRR
jgi:hypothetical protein